MTSITSDLFAHEVVERLNSLLPDYVRHADDHFRKTTFIRTVMTRYASSGRPLSGYFAVCGVIEIQWTILAQVLAPPLQQPPVASTSTGILPLSQNMEAQASNIAWATIMAKPCGAPNPAKFAPYIVATRRALGAAAQCFADLLEQVEDFGEVDPEMYAFETMSESLVCASLSIFLAVIESIAEIGHRMHFGPQRG
jgi:phosphatidylinositol 4-kinase